MVTKGTLVMVRASRDSHGNVSNAVARDNGFLWVVEDSNEHGFACKSLTTGKTFFWYSDEVEVANVS